MSETIIIIMSGKKTLVGTSNEGNEHQPLLRACNNSQVNKKPRCNQGSELWHYPCIWTSSPFTGKMPSSLSHLLCLTSNRWCCLSPLAGHSGETVRPWINYSYFTAALAEIRSYSLSPVSSSCLHSLCSLPDTIIPLVRKKESKSGVAQLCLTHCEPHGHQSPPTHGIFLGKITSGLPFPASSNNHSCSPTLLCDQEWDKDGLITTEIFKNNCSN